MTAYLVLNPEKIEKGLEKINEYLKDKKDIFVVGNKDFLNVKNIEQNYVSMYKHKELIIMGYGTRRDIEKIIVKLAYCPKTIIIKEKLCFNSEKI